MNLRSFPILPAPTFNLTPLKENHYGLAKIDPPWAFETYSENGKEKSAEQHYDCMTLEDIFELDVDRLAHPDGGYPHPPDGQR